MLEIYGYFSSVAEHLPFGIYRDKKYVLKLHFVEKSQKPIVPYLSRREHRFMEFYVRNEFILVACVPI